MCQFGQKKKTQVCQSIFLVEKTHGNEQIRSNLPRLVFFGIEDKPNRFFYEITTQKKYSGHPITTLHSVFPKLLPIATNVLLVLVTKILNSQKKNRVQIIRASNLSLSYLE